MDHVSFTQQASFTRGGPDKGLFLQIITCHERDIPIPGMPYTFGVIAAGQALGDFQALKSLGRNITRIKLSTGDEKDVLNVAREFE